jgi:hypothetical protein
MWYQTIATGLVSDGMINSVWRAQAPWTMASRLLSLYGGSLRALQIALQHIEPIWRKGLCLSAAQDVV